MGNQAVCCVPSSDDKKRSPRFASKNDRGRRGTANNKKNKKEHAILSFQ